MHYKDDHDDTIPNDRFGFIVVGSEIYSENRYTN